MFVQDGDPSQNSKAAKTALEKIAAVQFSILPCSFDLNPIENAFNLVVMQPDIPFLKRLMQSLWKELKTLLSYPVEPR